MYINFYFFIFRLLQSQHAAVSQHGGGDRGVVTPHHSHPQAPRQPVYHKQPGTAPNIARQGISGHGTRWPATADPRMVCTPLTFGIEIIMSTYLKTN